MVMPKKPLDSDRYGRLAVLESVKGGWLCRCDCGNAVTVTGSHLREGRVVSCGCYHAERQREVPRKHGMKGAPGYDSWVDMRQRCTNPNSQDWPNYGGRGIRVCAAWDDFAQFIRDMGVPEPGRSIERNDVNGDYEPGNCRWATKLEQARNTRRTRFITLDGETKPLTEWCEERGVPYWTAHARLRRGATAEAALRGNVSVPTLPHLEAS